MSSTGPRLECLVPRWAAILGRSGDVGGWGLLIEMVTKCELLKVVSHISSCLVLSAF